MSRFIDRYRARRTAVRRQRAIERAIQSAPDERIREELRVIANRQAR